MKTSPLKSLDANKLKYHLKVGVVLLPLKMPAFLVEVLVQVPAPSLLIQPLLKALLGDSSLWHKWPGPSLCGGGPNGFPGFWLWLSPALAIASTEGVDQWLRYLSVSLCLANK